MSPGAASSSVPGTSSRTSSSSETGVPHVVKRTVSESPSRVNMIVPSVMPNS